MTPAPRLSLVQHFTVAALAIGGGVAAAMGADAVVRHTLGDGMLLSFIVNFGTMAAVTGGIAGYAEKSFAYYNRTRPLQDWALPAQRWWDKKEGPR